MFRLDGTANDLRQADYNIYLPHFYIFLKACYFSPVP